MKPIDRRAFLSTLGCSLAVQAMPLRAAERLMADPWMTRCPGSPCWLDVAIPFIVEDSARDLRTEIVLTSTSFGGVRGYAERAYSTDYEIYLYDQSGEPQRLAQDRIEAQSIRTGDPKRLNIPALHATAIRLSDLIGSDKKFFGGMRIRVAPRGGDATHVGDLFSVGFVKWYTSQRFDNVHANPDPPQLASGRYFYTMPFPELAEYHCELALFNPYSSASRGKIIMFDPTAAKLVTRTYDLKPRGSLLFDLSAEEFSPDTKLLTSSNALSPSRRPSGGSIVIENETVVAKTFAYLMIKGRTQPIFSCEHPLHFGDYLVKPASAAPLDPNKALRAKTFVYSPMFFKQKKLGDLVLSSRVYLSTGRPLEETLWAMMFVTDANGSVRWISSKDEDLSKRLPEKSFYHQGLIRLGLFQSATIPAESLPVDGGLSGGVAIATSPPTSHTVMKIEVQALNWGAGAFTHFRPGGTIPRAYRHASGRGEVMTDYIVSGVRLKRSGQRLTHDCLLGVMNIDFESETEGDPVLEVFGSTGFIASKKLGRIPALACQHFLLSDFFEEVDSGDGYLTLRLVDPSGLLIMSALHIDYQRKDIALDHGSDRHSTYQDYFCKSR